MHLKLALRAPERPGDDVRLLLTKLALLLSLVDVISVLQATYAEH